MPWKRIGLGLNSRALAKGDAPLTVPPLPNLGYGSLLIPGWGIGFCDDDTSCAIFPAATNRRQDSRTPRGGKQYVGKLTSFNTSGLPA